VSWILGLNAYHGDSSACLFHEGRLVAAAEEERFNRTKHWAGFPAQAIRYCLQEGDISLSQVEHVALNRKPWAQIGRKLWFALTNRPDTKLVGNRVSNAKDWLLVRQQFAQYLGDDGLTAKVHFVEHHHAHLASSFLASPFERAVVVSVDGFGDFCSAAWGVGDQGRLRITGRVFFPHSLGLFYLALTQFLGFLNYGDEYKVMGLAAYGQPAYTREMAELVHLLPTGGFALNLDYFCHHVQNVGYEWRNTAPSIGKVYAPALSKLLGPERAPDEPLTQRHQDIAHSLQQRFEAALFHLLGRLAERHRLPDLCLAGGCAMNSVANGKILPQTPFRRLYVQSAPGDAGGAMGAALVVWNERLRQPRRFVMEHAYWGPGYANGEIAALLDQRAADLEEQGCTVERISGEEELLERTARAIAAGRVVGFFHGRMEWGPRALGNRSILADPRRADMKDILNLKIKRRESFRPFAPSILREAVPEFFEQDDDVPFMLQVFAIRPEKRPLIPAVTHVDGSGRLQSVRREENPHYYRLIQKVQDLTGVPIVLNTSFNENEPVVNRPSEALDCFLRTRMDVLVLEDYFISRGGGEG